LPSPWGTFNRTGENLMNSDETAPLEETKIKTEEEVRLKAEEEARISALVAEVKRKEAELQANFRKQTQTQLFKQGFSISQAVRIHKGEGSSISEIMNWPRMRYGGNQEGVKSCRT